MGPWATSHPHFDLTSGRRGQWSLGQTPAAAERGAFPRSTSLRLSKHSSSPAQKAGIRTQPYGGAPSPIAIARQGRLEGRTGRELAGQAGAARPLDPAGSLHHPGLPRRSRLGGVGPSAAPSSWGSGRGAGPLGTEPCHPPTPVPKPAQCTWVTPANRALPLVTMTTSERPSWQELEAPSICDQLPNPHSFPGRKEVAAGHLATAPTALALRSPIVPSGEGRAVALESRLGPPARGALCAAKRNPGCAGAGAGQRALIADGTQTRPPRRA